MTIDPNHSITALIADRASLLGYIRAIVGDPHLAEDIFQEVVLVVVRKGGGPDDPARFPAWLRTIARYEALNAMRKWQTPVAFDADLLDAIDARWTSDEDALRQRPETEALRACLQRLTPTSRQLVAAKYERSQSGAQIAAEFGRSVNTVYVALTRIHKALAECIRSRLARGAADAG